MSTRVQRRRGSAAAHSTFIGAEGEITVMTDEKRLVVHDGATAGGIPVARKDEVTAEVSRAIGNADFSFQITDRLVVPNATFTAARTGILPLASAVSAGRTISFFDSLPAIGGANVLTVARSGSDMINGATSFSCARARGRWDFVSDGVSKWSVPVENAPLASPALTGTPTAPTAVAGTNTTQLATTAFVKAALDLLVASAPGALDTLDELAAALGDDANFSATVATSLANRLRVDADQGLSISQQACGRGNLGLGSGALSGFRDKLINGDGRVNTRAATTAADDTYAWDRWNVLTQTAAIGVSTLVAPASGIAAMMRLTQTQATAQRMGAEQIIEATETYGLRGKTVTFGGKQRCSSAATIRYVILEWTGTADAPVSDIVNSWTNGTFTAGQFFNATTLNVLAVGATTLSPATLTDFAISATVGASATNLIAFAWTEGAVAQNTTLDLRCYLVEGTVTGEADPFSPRNIADEFVMCSRFYQKFQFRTSGYASASSEGWYFRYPFPVIMRTTPAVAHQSPSTTNLTSQSISGIDQTSYAVDLVSFTTGGFQYIGTLTADAEL